MTTPEEKRKIRRLGNDVTDIFAALGGIQSAQKVHSRYHLDHKVQSRRIESKVDGLEARVGRVEEKLDRVGESVGRVDSKVDDLDSKVGQMSTKFDRLEAKADNLDSKIDRILGALRG